MYIVSFILFVLCILFPLFHTFNALKASKKTPSYLEVTPDKEVGMSILIPCYNEASILSTTIQGMKQLHYHNYELIFINDGSTDETMKSLFSELELIPQEFKKPAHALDFMPVRQIYLSSQYKDVLVIDKENGGKADSLNAGITYATNDIVITLDADSVLDAKALSILNQVFDDSSVIAAGGNVHILQGLEQTRNGFVPSLRKMKQIVRFQILEYLRGFYILKASLANSNALSIISGAFGAFKRNVLLEVGGYRQTIGEDIDVTLKVQQYAMKHKGSRVLFVPEAICFTEVPESWKDLYNQRIRWQKAFMDCFVLYFKTFIKSMVTNRISFFFLVDSFLVGVVASYFTGFFLITLIVSISEISWKVIQFYVIGSLVVNMLYIVISLIISNQYGFGYSKRNLFAIISTIFLDLFIFRFINLFYIMIGSAAYFVNKEGWNKVARTGRDYSIEEVYKQSA
ncbi:cellulose synthase/poly-beta-1,6-N-acetylglucosamine synthase-like glycosyltransferase [Neobacillus bataviensis]|uniref:Cellulose synthase/poly-beta-1,6-N-acetylglucosamine synthase-like glycosyltransferase n=1 Tax=Neobacillus bataviensis TaxID=220685 RepID=A0A561CZD1_9BACI|nr:glycosyltransferase [Neobacillus bataviensis]TWD96432.1 cellulose synthase/poly-beta-1,6-N-acetylglucosamine synthase-like glycosyltransferase [Neobacillus bataviensis]